jgi:hypothetical protein
MSESKQKSLEVKVTASETNGVLQFEGSVTVPGLAKTKLANKDGVTKFESISNLKAVARRVAEKLNYGVTYDEASAQRRVAAKRSATSKKKTATSSSVPSPNYD